MLVHMMSMVMPQAVAKMVVSAVTIEVKLVRCWWFMLAAVAGMLVSPHSNRHLGSHRSHNSAAAVPILT